MIGSGGGGGDGFRHRSWSEAPRTGAAIRRPRWGSAIVTLASQWGALRWRGHQALARAHLVRGSSHRHGLEWEEHRHQGGVRRISIRRVFGVLAGIRVQDQPVGLLIPRIPYGFQACHPEGWTQGSPRTTVSPSVGGNLTATLTATRIVIVSTSRTYRTSVRDESYSKRPRWTLSDGSVRDS
jgi:hypothetical protein